MLLGQDWGRAQSLLIWDTGCKSPGVAGWGFGEGTGSPTRPSRVWLRENVSNVPSRACVPPVHLQLPSARVGRLGACSGDTPAQAPSQTPVLCSGDGPGSCLPWPGSPSPGALLGGWAPRAPGGHTPWLPLGAPIRLVLLTSAKLSPFGPAVHGWVGRGQGGLWPRGAAGCSIGGQREMLAQPGGSFLPLHCSPSIPTPCTTGPQQSSQALRTEGRECPSCSPSCPS